MLVYDKEKRPILQVTLLRPREVAGLFRSSIHSSRLSPVRRDRVGQTCCMQSRLDVQRGQVEIGVDDGDIEVDADMDDAALVRVGGEQWRLTLLGLENKIRFFTQVASRCPRPARIVLRGHDPLEDLGSFMMYLKIESPILYYIN